LDKYSSKLIKYINPAIQLNLLIYKSLQFKKLIIDQKRKIKLDSLEG